MAGFSVPQRDHARNLHTALCVVVRRFAPSKKRLSANPLALLWQSTSLRQSLAFVLAFRTHVVNMEMIFLQLECDGLFDRPTPYELRFKPHALRAGVPAHWNDLAMCSHLARCGQDWTLSQLLLGDITDCAAHFVVVERKDYAMDDLLAEAVQQKEEERALRAARLARGAGEKKKRARTARGRGRERGRGRGGRRRQAEPAPEAEVRESDAEDVHDRGYEADEDEEDYVDEDEHWPLHELLLAEAPALAEQVGGDGQIAEAEAAEDAEHPLAELAGHLRHAQGSR